jgi:hypothetical protein
VKPASLTGRAPARPPAISAGFRAKDMLPEVKAPTWAAWSTSPGARKQPAQQDGKQEGNSSRNEEVAERKLLPALAASALPFSSR